MNRMIVLSLGLAFALAACERPPQSTPVSTNCGVESNNSLVFNGMIVDESGCHPNPNADRGNVTEVPEFVAPGNKARF